jgi:uncharacterized protein (DUF3820 family)
MKKLTDSSLMPWGRHKGTRMIDIPAKDLIGYYENGKCSREVFEYIQDNIDVLHEEIKREKVNKRQ